MDDGGVVNGDVGIKGILIERGSENDILCVIVGEEVTAGNWLAALSYISLQVQSLCWSAPTSI